MAKQQGTKFKLYQKLSGGTKKAIANIRTNSINLESETIDVSTKSSNNWREFLAGYRTFTMEVDGLVDFNITGGAEVDASALTEAWLNQTTLNVESTDNVSGSKVFTGDVFLTAFNISAAHDDAVTFTATLQGTGALAITSVT